MNRVLVMHMFLRYKKALEMAKHHETTAVSNDTDILVLLMYHWCSTMKDILFATTKSVNKKKVHVEYSVRDLVNKQPLTPYQLFAHAWTGCTSAIQNQGKLNTLRQQQRTPKRTLTAPTASTV